LICGPCKRNDHRHCEGDCDCSREEQQIDRLVNSGADEELAEMILSSLLAGCSEVTQMLVNGGGKPAVELFVRQVLRANKALKC
jgi:hypothetical protein